MIILCLPQRRLSRPLTDPWQAASPMLPDVAFRSAVRRDGRGGDPADPRRRGLIEFGLLAAIKEGFPDLPVMTVTAYGRGARTKTFRVAKQRVDIALCFVCQAQGDVHGSEESSRPFGGRQEGFEDEAGASRWEEGGQDQKGPGSRQKGGGNSKA
jgi:hypothetical protein